MKGGKSVVNVFNSQTYSIKPKKSMNLFFKEPFKKYDATFKDPYKSGKKKCKFHVEDENMIIEFDNSDENIIGDIADDTFILPTGIYINYNQIEFDEYDYNLSQPIECIRMKENKNSVKDIFYATSLTGSVGVLGAVMGTMVTGTPVLAGSMGALGIGSLLSGMIYYGHYGIVIKSVNKDTGNNYMTFIQVGSVGTQKGAYDELAIEWRIYYNFNGNITDTLIKNYLEKFVILDKYDVIKEGTMGNYKEIIDQISNESVYNPTPGPKQLSSMKDTRNFDPSARYHNCVTITNYILDLITKNTENTMKGKKRKTISKSSKSKSNKSKSSKSKSNKSKSNKSKSKSITRQTKKKR